MAAFIFAIALLASSSAFANDGITALTVTSASGSEEYSVKLQILILMTLLGLVTPFLLMCTSYGYVIVVLSFVRQGLGLQQSPPNMILNGIALCLTILIMRPVGEEIYEKAYLPHEAGEITFMEGLELASIPMKSFMLDQTKEQRIRQFQSIADDNTVDVEAAPFTILLPAYATTMMEKAFTAGFMILLFFLIIDIVTAAVLTSMGMIMLSPLIVSLIFKLLAFVVFDGWGMIMGSISRSFIFYGS
ncbi:flagellar type III secretion system pore protein FliP [Vibrio breoganii]